LDQGARVFICARNGNDVKQTITSLRETYGDSVYGTECDVGSYESVREMFRNAVRAVGTLDILVNNAGIGSHTYVENMHVEEWTATIGTNLSGVFYCCREGLPLLKKAGGGYIINIGSLAGTNTFPGAAAYCASKFGLIGFSEALMQEVRFDHIRVSYIMPGSVNTTFGRSGAQDPATTWKLSPADVALTVTGLLEMDPRALASRVEMRPSEPKK